MKATRERLEQVKARRDALRPLLRAEVDKHSRIRGDGPYCDCVHCGAPVPKSMRGACCSDMAFALGQVGLCEWIALNEESVRLTRALEEMEQNIPARYHEVTVASFLPSIGTEKMRYAAARYIESLGTDEDCIDEGKGLFMQGSPGAGKTHLAVAILKAALVKGHSGYFGPMYEIIERAKRSYSTDEEVAERLASVDLLVVDDLGQERLTDWRRELTFTIFSRRYNESKAIIVTTNLPGAVISKRYSDSFFSRLVGASHVVALKDVPDFRRQQ